MSSLESSCMLYLHITLPLIFTLLLCPFTVYCTFTGFVLYLYLWLLLSHSYTEMWLKCIAGGHKRYYRHVHNKQHNVLNGQNISTILHLTNSQEDQKRIKELGYSFQRNTTQKITQPANLTSEKHMKNR